MNGQLITFPVRLYVRGARLLVHAAEDVTGKAVMGSLRLAGALGSLRPGSDSGHTAAPAPQPQPRPPAARPPSRVRPVTGPPRPDGSRATAAPRPRPETPQPPASPTPAAATAEAPPLASERLEQEGRTHAIDLEAPAPVAPDHVSSEPVLVREESELGAEDGAGASISVQEPWEGYRSLNARDVVARLAAASTAELAAVQLYESTHRKRQTVIAAAQRELSKPQR